MTRERAPTDDTGMPVYPRLPRKPDTRDGEAKPEESGRLANINKRLAVMFAGALVFGGLIGFMLRSCLSNDAKVSELSTKLAEADKAAGALKQRANGLDKELDQMRAAKLANEKKLVDAEKAQSEVATKTGEIEKATEAAKAAQDKLDKVIDKSTGVMSIDNGELHIAINSSSLFFPTNAELSPAGKAILDKVIATLKDIPEKQISIEGHTDDSPPPIPVAAPAPKPAAPAGKPDPKAKKQPPPPKPAAPAAPLPRFATNWELSAARALAVLHYLQDKGRIDPRRLSALALGQYHPLSKSNRALNRRIDIVVKAPG